MFEAPTTPDHPAGQTGARRTHQWLTPNLLGLAGATAVVLCAALAGLGRATAQPAPSHQPSPPAATAPPSTQAPATPPSQSAPTPSLKQVQPGDMKSGSLLLRSSEGGYVAAPNLGADYDLVVSGPTSRARVTQMFRNPGNSFVEAVYVYPLPEGAAVDSLKMIIGERVVIGSIKPRQEAKATYEAAKARGQKAALVEQERPNLFTNSVANIGPGETVVVQLEYQEPVRRSGSTFSLRIPLVVAPRYNPMPIVQTVDLGSDGWGRVASDPVPDRARIEPTYLDPAKNQPVNPVTIKVRLAAGFPLGEVKSRYHALKTDEVDEQTRTLILEKGAIPADRDFELNWQPASATAPAVGLFRETVAGADYILAFVTPPPGSAAATERRPREMILVIDNSGSMGGTSMAQAKASLQFALKRLGPSDRFNVIRFNHTMDTLFSGPQPADPQNIQRAMGWVDSLQATGGTEMLPALNAALVDSNPNDKTHLRQIVFLTDGAIGNEHQLLDAIGSGRGRSRVFTVGIGSAPNSYLMTRAAELGRGTFTHIGSVNEVAERMQNLFEKLESPVVTGLTTRVLDNEADATPDILPDLYRGEPLVIAAKLAKSGGTLEIKGNIGDQPWLVTLPLANAAEGKGLSKLWARRKIADAEVARTLRSKTPAESDQIILKLALDHSLVSRLTSLVAVDDEIARKPGQPLTRADIPLNLPAGWDFSKVFGDSTQRPALRDTRADITRPDTSTQTQGHLSPTSLRSSLATAAQHRPASPPRMIAQGTSQHVALPQTATDAEIRLWTGLALLLSGLGALAYTRRRNGWLDQR